METEIRRRLNILNRIKVPRITARQLRGGMQKRLHRREIIRYGRDVESQKKKIGDRLSLIEQEKLIETTGDFRAFSTSSMEPLDEFNEPTFRRIRNRRGFF